MAQEMPNIWDQFGRLVPIPEAVLDHLSEAACVCYDQVVARYDDCRELESEIAEKTKTLHSVVAELREVEHRISMLPRPSRIDLVRTDLIAMNR